MVAVEYRRLTAHTTRVPKRHVCTISGILVQRPERYFPPRCPSPDASLVPAPRAGPSSAPCPRSAPGSDSRFCRGSRSCPSSGPSPSSGPGSDSRAGPRFSQSPSPYPLTRISRPFFPATTPAPPFSSLPSIARLDSRPRPLSPATVHGPCCRARARAPRSVRAPPCARVACCTHVSRRAPALPALASCAAPASGLCPRWGRYRRGIVHSLAPLPAL